MAAPKNLALIHRMRPTDIRHAFATPQFIASMERMHMQAERCNAREPRRSCGSMSVDTVSPSLFYFVCVSGRHARVGACTTMPLNTVRLLRRLHLWAGPLQTALPHLKIIAPHRHLGNRISAAASLRPDASAFLCPYAYPDAVPVRLFVNLQVDKPVKTLTANTIAGMPARRRRPSIGDFRSWNGFSP